jgi:hypothetical protein
MKPLLMFALFLPFIVLTLRDTRLRMTRQAPERH